MPQESIWTVLITAFTVLGSASAWRFYEKRALRKEKDEDFIKTDCRDRIGKLEALLQASSNGINSLSINALIVKNNPSTIIIDPYT